MGLGKEFTLLVADRNSHVRELIKREMTAEGYRVRLAGNSHEVIQQVYRHESLDLLILDPDLPDTDVSLLLKKLQNRIPYLPMVIHAFGSDYGDHTPFLKTAVFVDKGANSVEILKTVAYEILRKPNQQQTKAQNGNDQHADQPLHASQRSLNKSVLPFINPQHGSDYHIGVDHAHAPGRWRFPGSILPFLPQ